MSESDVYMPEDGPISYPKTCPFCGTTYPLHDANMRMNPIIWFKEAIYWRRAKKCHYTGGRQSDWEPGPNTTVMVDISTIPEDD